MRTTVDLDADLLRDARRRAAERETTLSVVVADALRADLIRRTTPPAQEHLSSVTFYGEGGTQPGVDINDRRALADVLDG